MRAACLLLAVFLAAAAPAAAQERTDPAAELMSRTYCLAPLPAGPVAAGTTFGIVLFDPPSADAAAAAAPLGAPRPGLKLPDSVNDLLYQDGRLYVANGPAGLRVVSVAPDGALALEAHVPTEGAAMTLTRDGTRLFVAQAVMGVAVVDITEPSSPVRIATLSTEGYARHVAVQHTVGGSGGDATLYVANGDGGLVALKVDQDLALLTAAVLPVKGDVRRVALEAGRLYFSRGSRGVCSILPGLDPASMSCIDVKDVGRDLVVVDGRVLVADGGEGVAAIDWADPAAPKVLGRYKPAQGSMNRILVVGDRIFVAADYAGALSLPLADVLAAPQKVQ